MQRASKISFICDHRSTIRFDTIPDQGRTKRRFTPKSSHGVFRFLLVINCMSFHYVKKTGVQISDVIYRDVAGTSASKIAINLNCSKSVPCYGILMESMQLTSAITGREVTANCSNAYGREKDAVPGPCLRRY